MATVQAINFTSNPRTGSSIDKDKKEKAQNVATAVGGTAFALLQTSLASHSCCFCGKTSTTDSSRYILSFFFFVFVDR